MRNIVFFALAALVIAGFVPRLAGRFEKAPAVSAAPTVTAVQAAPPKTSAGPRTVMIERDRRGHFQVDGVVDGRRIGFMVDTGASSVALTQSDAARLGYHPPYRDYTAEVRTANGLVRVAPISLGMVEVGGVMVRDVAAVVMPDETLTENLLGLSFLSRLRRFEYREGRLVLEE